jgi:hypothetical protein
MRMAKRSWVLAASALALACGGDGNGGEGSADGNGETAGSLTANDGTGSASVSASASASAEGTAGETQADTSTSADDAEDDGAEGTIFDVHSTVDVGVSACGGKGGGGKAPEFSYIWVANSSQGTISKINTQTMMEEGRYIVRPDSAGSPSRTSVNLSGDVAVANRSGGVTKVYANTEACQESNGMGGLQTSNGAANILPWGTEECVAWHTPFAYSTQRPVAWAPAPFDENTCSYPDQKLWTSGANFGGQITVHLLDGETGEIEQTIPIPELEVGSFGAYGGAVNGDGDFWITTYDQPPQLARVDRSSFDYEIVTGPSIHSYGMTVDSKGRPWIGGFIGGSARYTPETGTWDVLDNVLGYGIQEDADGMMWMATFSPNGVRSFDSDSLALGVEVNLPGFGAKGVSIDFYGYVWVVDMGTSAHRIDPVSLMVDSYNGLTGPYTYSDMTGWGLSNVTFPPQG